MKGQLGWLPWPLSIVSLPLHQQGNKPLSLQLIIAHTIYFHCSFNQWQTKGVQSRAVTFCFRSRKPTTRFGFRSCQSGTEVGFRVPENGTHPGFRVPWNPQPIGTFSEKTAEELMNVSLCFKIKKKNFKRCSVPKERNPKGQVTVRALVYSEMDFNFIFS